jgi:hypothetical protein
VSRPDRRALRKPQGPQSASDQEQEQELETQTEQEGQEQEHSRSQNQLGNAAVADMLASRNKPDGHGADQGGGKLAQEASGSEKQGSEFGGDDDPVEVDTVTIAELAAAWNPTTKKKEDRPAFLEAMPSDDLPPEDQAWLQSLRTLRAPDLPDVDFPDGLLQPSDLAVTGSLGPWAREVGRWLDPRLEHRCLSQTIAKPPPCIHDPGGRVIFSRARVAALASWGLLDTDLLSSGADVSTTAFLDFTLETASGARRVHEATRHVLELENKLPRASTMLAELLPRDGRTVKAMPLPPAATARIIAVLTDLTGLEPVLAPSLVLGSVTVDPDDDPLGLDAVIEQHTGGRADPEEPVFHAAVQGAERLAGACARTRVAFVGAALATGDACLGWSTGIPTETLASLAAHLDERVQTILQLLVEVARAAKRRSVPPRGLANGLKRATRQLEQIRKASFGALSQVAGAVIPGSPSVPDLPSSAPDDPLTAAWLDGRPREALPWLESLPHGYAQATAVALVRCSSGMPPAQLIAPLLAAATLCEDAGRSHVARALETLAGPCMIWADAPEDALKLARRHLQLGKARRNGSVIASAALLACEAHLMAGRPDEAQAVRTDAGLWCWHIGAYGPLSLLARVRPAEE